jgi:hypothetical protein
VQDRSHLFVCDPRDSVCLFENFFKKLDEDIETVFTFSKLTPIGRIRSGQQTFEGPFDPASKKVDEASLDSNDINSVFRESPDCL